MNDESKKWLWWAIPVVVAAGLIAALYYGRKHKEEPVAQQVRTEPVAQAPLTPEDHKIEPEGDSSQSLPPRNMCPRASSSALRSG